MALCNIRPLFIPFLIAFAFGVFPPRVGRAERVDDAAFKEIEKKEKNKLTSSNLDERIIAIAALAATDHPKALKLLMDAMRNESQPRILFAYAEALGMFTDAEAVETVDKYLVKLTADHDLYSVYKIMKGLAASDRDATRPIVLKALSPDVKRLWQTLAAVEAAGESGHASYVEPLLTLLASEVADWDRTHQIVPVTIIHALARLGAAEKDPLPVMEALVGVLERFTDSRVRFHAARALSKLAKIEEASDHVPYWRWWIERQRTGQSAGNEPEKRKSRTDTRVEFVEMEAVGRRLVFCIDVSDSMKEEISPRIREKRQETEKKREITGHKGEGKKEDKNPKREKKDERKDLDWSRIKTRLDLAKADLVRSLGTLTEQYDFNVVVYSSGSDYLDPKVTGFIKGTQANIKKYITMVNNLKLEAMTNIHGGMLDAFRATTKGQSFGDPATNNVGILNGADTIFFLTDGWGSWSDDSEEGVRVPDPRRKNDPEPRIGNGKFIVGDDILAEFERINKFRKVIVNTVGIGNHDRKLMEGMARVSGGQYVDFSD